MFENLKINCALCNKANFKFLMLKKDNSFICRNCLYLCDKFNGNNSINNLKGKINTISTTIASNSSTANTTSNTSISTTNTNNSTSDNTINAITGNFYPQIDGANDASYFSFNSNGTVNLEGNATMSGTYSIENNTIKIKYTKLTEPGMESTTINEEENLTIVDKTTLFDNKTNTTYKK